MKPALLLLVALSFFAHIGVAAEEYKLGTPFDVRCTVAGESGGGDRVSVSFVPHKAFGNAYDKVVDRTLAEQFARLALLRHYKAAKIETADFNCKKTKYDGKKRATYEFFVAWVNVVEEAKPAPQPNAAGAAADAAASSSSAQVPARGGDKPLENAAEIPVGAAQTSADISSAASVNSASRAAISASQTSASSASTNEPTAPQK